MNYSETPKRPLSSRRKYYLPGRLGRGGKAPWWWMGMNWELLLAWVGVWVTGVFLASETGVFLSSVWDFTSLGGKLLPWSLFTSRGLMFSLKVTMGFSPVSQLLLRFRPVDSTDFSPGFPSAASGSITDVSCRMRFSLASVGSSSINSGISVINNNFPTSFSHWISLKK